MKYGICFLLMAGFLFLPFSPVGAASWQGGVDVVADGDVTTNAGFTGPGRISITVSAPNSANFNNSGANVDNLGFVVSDSINISGDLWHNNGLIANGSGGFGVLGDNTYMTADILNVGGEIVMGNGSNSYQMTLNINEINANDITTNTGSKLVLNPDYTSNPTMNITNNLSFEDGLYMGDGPIGTESVHINSYDANNTYTINANNFNVDGSVNAELGRLSVNSNTNIDISGSVVGDVILAANDDIYIGGNWGRGVNMVAKNIFIGGDISEGVRIAANNVGPDGVHTSFDRTDINVNGTYHFNNDSFLQLVLNQDVANSDGNAEYDADLDIALIKVGGFDASGVTKISDINDMSTTPNIEILVDNIMQELNRIKLLESATEITDLGALNLVGIWFYDTANQTRLFQEAGIVLSSDNKTIFLNVATMRSIAGMVALVPQSAGPTNNDMQMALAIDDLILKRLNTGRIDGHYSSLMRLMFPTGDIYNKMMINGGNYYDALYVMIADGVGYETDETYIRAMDYVRQFALSDVDMINRAMALSGRILRIGVTDHLMDDFIWQRYHDKGVGWANLTLNSPGDGGSIVSFSGGVDWQFGDKWMLGATVGYNNLNFGGTSGNTLSFGAYGAWDITSWGRAYGAANLMFNSIDLETNSPLTGNLEANISTSDATLELGILHRFYSTYLMGRAYVTAGSFGGYDLTKKVKSGQSFMDIKYDDSFVVTPGYEISLGKDIFMGLWAFVRPSVKFGIEYDLLERASDFQFKFSESSIYRDWKGKGSGSRLWLRYGLQAEFAVSQGANLVVGYEILKNGELSSKSFKLSGSVRF